MCDNNKSERQTLIEKIMKDRYGNDDRNEFFLESLTLKELKELAISEEEENDED